MRPIIWEPRSGRLYRIPFVMNESLSRPQNFVSTVANRAAVPLTYATLSDLKRLIQSNAMRCTMTKPVSAMKIARSCVRLMPRCSVGWKQTAFQLVHNVQKLS